MKNRNLKSLFLLSSLLSFFSCDGSSTYDFSSKKQHVLNAAQTCLQNDRDFLKWLYSLSKTPELPASQGGPQLIEKINFTSSTIKKSVENDRSWDVNLTAEVEGNKNELIKLGLKEETPLKTTFEILVSVDEKRGPPLIIFLPNSIQFTPSLYKVKSKDGKETPYQDFCRNL